MWAILWMVLMQLPCVSGDSTLVCHCKQGMVSACEVLRQTEPRMVAEIETALAVASAMTEAEKRSEALGAEASVAASAPEPPDCKGQRHHIISKRIAKALEKHPVLQGRYVARDPRFVAQAADEKAHCGYQSWHRDVDDEVVEWLLRRQDATVEEFEAFLREIYSRPLMQARFPRGF